MGNVQISAPTLHLTAAAKYIKHRSVIFCGDVCWSHIQVQEKQTPCVRLGVTKVHNVEKRSGATNRDSRTLVSAPQQSALVVHQLSPE